MQLYNPPSLNTATELFTLSSSDNTSGGGGGNMATTANLRQWIALSAAVMAMTVEVNGTSFTAYDVCAGRLNQSPYTWGCDIITSADYFSEGAFTNPTLGAAQYELDQATLNWTWVIAADVQPPVTTFVNATVTAQCAAGGALNASDCAALRTANASTAAAILNRLPLALLSGTPAQHSAKWRLLFVNNSFVNRHLNRPSIANDPLLTLTKPGPDLLTQQLQPLIFGARVPHTPVAGQCGTCAPGWAGLACATPYDPLCTCNAGFGATCVNAIFQGCLPYSTCASQQTLVYLAAQGALVAPSIDFGPFQNYPDKAKAATAFYLNASHALDDVVAACVFAAPCANASTLDFPAAWRPVVLASRALALADSAAFTQFTTLGSQSLTWADRNALFACANATTPPLTVTSTCLALSTSLAPSSSPCAPSFAAYFACLAAQAPSRFFNTTACPSAPARQCAAALPVALAPIPAAFSAQQAALWAIAGAVQPLNLSFAWVAASQVNSVLAGFCTEAQVVVPPVSIAPADCATLLSHVQGALVNNQAEITAISLALAKYGFLGALNGACTQTNPLEPLLGGGDCWSDADCSSRATCNLTGLALLQSVGTLAAAFMSASPEAIQARLVSDSAARYRALANAPYLSSAQGAVNVSLDDAALVLYTWRRALEVLVANFSPDATVLTADGPDVLLAQFSSAQVPVIIAGYALMVVFCALTLTACASRDWRVKSRARIGIVGVVLVALSVASGLSIAHLAGVPFSAAATQIIPFLMLGLGMNATFVFIRTFPLARADDSSALDAVHTGLRRSVPAVLVMGLTDAGVFAVGNLALMPVVTDFASQAAIVVGVNLVTFLVCVPVYLVFDFNRQLRRSADLLVCCAAVDKAVAAEDDVDDASTNIVERSCVPRYAAAMVTLPARLFCACVMIALVVAGAVGVVDYAALGLAFGDVAPQGTMLAKALALRDAEFPFYGATIITGPADFSSREAQQALPDLYSEIMDTSKLVAGSGYAWMLPFMAWGVPSTTVYNTSTGGGACDPASPTTQGACGAKVGCQVVTTDPSILTGAIPFFPPADFYRCLEAWINSDLVYEVLDPGFVLVDASAPKGSRKLAYSAPNQIPFSRGDVICKALTTTEDFVTLIDQVSAVANNFTAFPAFAIGAPFDYYYQYLTMNSVIASALGYGLLICFVASLAVIAVVVESNSRWRKLGVAVWSGLIITAVVCMIVFEIWGFLGYATGDFHHHVRGRGRGRHSAHHRGLCQGQGRLAQRARRYGAQGNDAARHGRLGHDVLRHCVHCGVAVCLCGQVLFRAVPAHHLLCGNQRPHRASLSARRRRPAAARRPGRFATPRARDGHGAGQARAGQARAGGVFLPGAGDRRSDQRQPH